MLLKGQVSVNNIKCALLSWTEYLLFTFLFRVFVLISILLRSTKNMNFYIQIFLETK
jgi:hypothetical protein